MNPLPALLAASALALSAAAQDADLNKTLPIKFHTAVTDHAIPAKPLEIWKEPKTDAVELPKSLSLTLALSGKGASVQDYEHLILFDADVRGDDGEIDVSMRRRWYIQSESLKNQLLALGAPAVSVRVAALYSADDLKAPFEASTKPKIVYVFSHAGPYKFEFNIGDVDFRRPGRVEFFLKHNVQAIVAYGCSFLAPDPEARRLFAAAMGNRKLILVGHEKESTGRDDSELHPDNPLYVEEMGRDCPIRRVSRCAHEDSKAAPLFPLSSTCGPK